MDRREAVMFLFSMAKEIKLSYESPVILFTMKDYADRIFKSLVEMRNALLEKAPPSRIVDIITNVHYEWLNATKEIDAFKNKINDLPREQVYQALDFTRDCVRQRISYFQRFVDQLQSTMSAEESTLMRTDINAISDLHVSVNILLNEKYTCFRSSGDPSQFKILVAQETEELMNWLDTINDHLVLHFSKVVGLKHPQFLSDLTNTLDNIVEEVATSTDPMVQELMKEMQNRKLRLSCVIRLNTNEELEIRKILEKIKSLECRIERLKLRDSSAVMALQHKTMYLEDRLNSLENLKISLLTLKNKRMDDIESKHSSKCQEVHIFDHLLPPSDRQRLVQELVALWNEALYGDQEGKSIISILSVADIKEVYSDDLGQFTIDKHGRKLYRGSTAADHVYQVNHKNELVPVLDDDKHVYFYDNCGRYYIGENNQRVYKAHTRASEYLINHDGVLLKFMEEIDGVEYYYDNLGRYRFNECGKKIYSEPDSDVEYENDGVGNLVRIRSFPMAYTECPGEPVATKEMKYLQSVVGAALKTCIADVIVHQPIDPILYLANSLEKYDKSIKSRDQRLKDDVELMLERERARESAAKMQASESTSDESKEDLNFHDYHTMHYFYP